MVPGDFAEKAMASLMSLHTELMDEKERRVELYRKLMEREQTVAELRTEGFLSGVKLLAYSSHVEPGVRDLALAEDFDLVVPRSRVAREGAQLVDGLIV